MAVVMLPRALVALFPAADRRVTLEGQTVGELIDGLEARWPGMRDRLCEPGPVLRQFINVYVDGEPADLASTVSEQTVVHVLPAVAGG
jgi:molybdopterin converting factor small subunit